MKLHYFIWGLAGESHYEENRIGAEKQNERLKFEGSL